MEMQEAVIETFDTFFRITEGIAMSDVIGWILAMLAGILAYNIIDNMQTSLERHSMLKEIEDSFTRLFNSPIAMKIKEEGAAYTDADMVFVRSVLHDDSDWEVVRDKSSNGIVFQIVHNQRYVKIRSISEINKEEEWISTQALHEITLRCRRIEKMFKSNIIKRIDLADMFRELVPMGTSGRLQFFSEYYSAYDTECMAYLVLQTVVSCHKYKNYDIVKYFAEYYNKHEEIHKYFYNNRRKRKILDAYAYMRFTSIVKEFK